MEENNSSFDSPIIYHEEDDTKARDVWNLYQNSLNEIENLRNDRDSLQKQYEEAAVNQETQTTAIDSKEKKSQSNNINNEFFLKDKLANLTNQNNTLLINIRDMTNSYNTLKKKLAIISSQLQKSETNANVESQKYKEAEMRNNLLQKELEEMKEEVKSLQIKKEEIEEQLSFNETRAKTEILSINKKSSNIDELHINIEDLKSVNQITHSLIENQKKEITTAYKDREMFLKLIYKQNVLLISFENYMKKLENEKKEILIKKNNQNSDLLSDHNKPTEQQECTIPLNTWACSQFPRELIKSVLEVAKLDNISINQKIPKILEIIASFYNNILENNDKLIRKSNIERGEYRDLIIKISDIVAENLGDNKYDIEIIKSNPLILCDFGERIHNLILSNKQLLEEKSKVDESLLLLHMKLHSNNITEVLAEIDSLIRKNKEINKKFKRTIVKYKQLKDIFKENEVKSNKVINEIKNEEQAFQKHISDLQNENNKLINSNKILFDQNAQYLEDINLLKQANQTEGESIKSKFSLEIENINEKVKLEKNEYNNQLLVLKEKEKEMNRKIAEYSDEVTKQNQTIITLKRAKDLKDQQCQKLASQFLEMKNQYLSKIQQNKESFSDQMKETADYWKQKNSYLKDLLDKATNALEQSDEQNKMLVEENKQTNIEIQQMSHIVELLKSEKEKCQHTYEEQKKEILFSSDQKIKSLAEKSKADIDAQKREMFSEIMSSFHYYSNISQTINDNNYKNVLSKVSNEIMRLQQQDSKIRNMLGISQADSLEEAVSNLFLSQYQT